MSNDDKFNYHRHLSNIAQADVEYLLWKDKQYGASWKESGRSAWFMVKRMVDRLTNMMARPKEPAGFDTVKARSFKGLDENYVPTDVDFVKYLRDCYLSEDLLAKVQSEGLEGQDGTVLAVLRDLRRYCLLVEAEITERLTLEMLKEYEVATSHPADESADDKFARYVLQYERDVPAEDSNRHAERSKIAPPWVIDEAWFLSNVHEDSAIRVWWEPHGRGTWRLRDHVLNHERVPLSVSPCVRRVINNVDGAACYVIDIAQCPKPLRSRYPKFAEENNLKEMSELPEWARALYYEDKANEKWVLRDKAWSVW